VEITVAELPRGKPSSTGCAPLRRCCHKNVLAHLDFQAAASLLVAAESSPASRLDRAFGSSPNVRIFFRPIRDPRFGLLLDDPTTITDWAVPNLR